MSTKRQRALLARTERMAAFAEIVAPLGFDGSDLYEGMVAVPPIQLDPGDSFRLEGSGKRFAFLRWEDGMDVAVYKDAHGRLGRMPYDGRVHKRLPKYVADTIDDKGRLGSHADRDRYARWRGIALEELDKSY